MSFIFVKIWPFYFDDDDKRNFPPNGQLPVANEPVFALEIACRVVRRHRHPILRRGKIARASALWLAFAESFSLHLFRGAMRGWRTFHRHFGADTPTRQAADFDAGDARGGGIFEKSVGDAAVFLRGWKKFGRNHRASVGNWRGAGFQGDFRWPIAGWNGGSEGLDYVVV